MTVETFGNLKDAYEWREAFFFLGGVGRVEEVRGTQSVGSDFSKVQIRAVPRQSPSVSYINQYQFTFLTPSEENRPKKVRTSVPLEHVHLGQHGDLGHGLFQG